MLKVHGNLVLEGPWEFGTWIESDSSKPKLSKLMKRAFAGESLEQITIDDPESYSKHKGALKKARSIYYQEEFNRRFLELDLVEWQKQLLVILEVVPDRRTIYWVYGRKGGEGKSTFGIYLIATKRAIMFNGGRREDVIFAYDYQNIAILDAARCQDIRYDIIEHFKDGVLFNQKYESHVILGYNMENRSPKMDGSSADFLHLGNHEISDFAFEYPYLQKIRVAEKVTGRFNISVIMKMKRMQIHHTADIYPPLLVQEKLIIYFQDIFWQSSIENLVTLENDDSPPPYSKQRRSENDRDFITPDETWYPMGGRKCDIRDVTNQQAWSCFVTENAEESLSWLRVKNHALRVQATNGSPSDSVARRNIRRYGRDIRSPVNKCSVENIYATDRHYEKSDNFHEWKKIDESGKFTKMCNPSSSSPAHYLNTTSQKKLRSEDSCLGKKRASSGPMCWTEDPFGAYPLPELHANAKSSFARSIHNVLPKLSPSGSFSLEKLGFCQPYSNVHSYETPVFSTIGSGRCKPNLHMDSNVEVRPQDSFPVSGSYRDAEFLRVLVEESVPKNGGNRSEIRNELSSENGQSLEASGSKDNCSDCNEAKGLTTELEERKATGSPEHAEEISSSVKIRYKFEGSIDEKDVILKIPFHVKTEV
ncbi:unnamed protein product [Camellia sinensis]